MSRSTGDASVVAKAQVVGLEDPPPRRHRSPGLGVDTRRGRDLGEPDAGRGHLRPCLAEHGIRRAGGDRGSVRPKSQDLVREPPGLVHSMLNEHDRRRAPGSQVGEPLQERGRTGRIQVGGRLIQDQDSGLRGQHAGQGEPLLLAARRPFRAWRRSNPASPTAASAPGTRACIRGLVQPRFYPIERDVVLDPVHDQLDRRVLEDEADRRGELGRFERRGLAPFRRLKQPGRRNSLGSRQERPEARPGECALSGSRRSDHQQAFTRFELHVHAMERRRSSSTIGEPELAGADAFPARKTARAAASDAPGQRGNLRYDRSPKTRERGRSMLRAAGSIQERPW